MTHLNVAVRVRPLSERETEVKAVPVVDIVNSNVVAITNLKVLEHNAGDSRERVRRFSFDYCFDRNTTQEQVFDAVENVIGGAIRNRYHTCVLAYGQSSSGKTHTIMGVDDDPGLTPRLCESVFNYIRQVDVEEEAKSITVSYLEIYNEKVKDLLSSDDRQNSLRVREHPSRGTYVQGLTHQVVNDSAALLERLQTGSKKRRVSATSINHRSSRSHSVFTIRCFGGVKLTLVDLAGSERTGSRNFNNTSTFREGANINKSLVALGNVIFALADQSKSTRKRYVPYRDSVLTWLLKDTLGGNSKTVMIATISPSHTCYNETVNTLRFGHRAKQIIAQPISNEDPKQKTIRDLKAEVARLKDLVSNHEIDPLFRTSVYSEVSRPLKTIDQSTNTEEPRLDENLQLTRKILDGLLEQIKAKLNDDFRWCKEELLKNSSGEGVFGEIIKNTFGKKLVCKEYSTNITQIYNVPEFKVFVYSDGKNIPSITGIEQNIIQSFNGRPPVAEVIEQDTQESLNIVSQGLAKVDLVRLNGSIVDEVDQNALKINSNLEPSANINLVSRFNANTDLVGQDISTDSPNEVSCNQGIASVQLVNEDLIKIEENVPKTAVVGENITTSIASIRQNIITGDTNAVSVKKFAATTQLINDDISSIDSTNDVPTSTVDNTENYTSAVPIVQGVTGVPLAKNEVDQNNLKVARDVSSSKRNVTNIELVSQGVANCNSVVQGGANAVLANQEATSTHLIDKNYTQANQNKPEAILESSNKGVTNVGAVGQHLAKVNSVALDFTEGGATSISNNEGAAGVQLANKNTDKVNLTSPKGDNDVISSNQRITQTGSIININLIAQDITKGETCTPTVNQDSTRFQLVHQNADKLDPSNRKGIPYIYPYKGVTNIRLDGADVTNIDFLVPKGDNNAVPDSQSNTSIENAIKLDQNSLKGIPYVDLTEKVIDQVASVSNCVTNIDSSSQNLTKVGIREDQVTPELRHTKESITNTNSLVQNITKGVTIPRKNSPELRNAPENITNINSLIENIAKVDINKEQLTSELRRTAKGITNIDSLVQNTAKGGINAKQVTTELRNTLTGISNLNSLVQNIAKLGISEEQIAPEDTNTTKGVTITEQLILKGASFDLTGPKLNTATKRLDPKVLHAATDKLIPVMDVSSIVSGSEKPVVKLRRTFSVCSADMESKKTKMYGSYETLSKYQQQPEPQLRKRSLDKSSSSVRNLKASTESVPENVNNANDMTKTFSKVEAKVDSIRKTPTKPRAEIVAAVTQRLYTKIKKKEVATETDDIVKEHKGTLARIRLQDITQRALRACRRRHAESQTETLPVLRVKETATDVQDLKIEAVEMKHAHVSTREVITKDAAINHSQDGTFDQPSGQSLVMTKSCGVQVNTSPPTSNKEDQQHLLSFTKYLRAQKEPKIEVSNRATANPIYTSSVNINVSHNYINRDDSVSGDSLEDQNNTNVVSLPTPDLISNHSSLEAEKAALGVSQTCVVKEERCRSLPNYQPKTYKLRVTETKPHETSFSIEQPTILKSIVKQSNDPDASDCASDCSDNSASHAFENVPDSLNYHFIKSVRFDEEPVNGRILEVMTNFLKEATNLMTNLAAAATNKFDADHAYDFQVTVSDAAGNVINRKPRRRPRRRKPRKSESSSQTCSNYECGNYEHAVSQTSPKKTSEKSVETDGEIPENKYESLVRKACDRLERCADTISADWYGPVQPEDSSMESNVTFSDYGSLPRQKLKYKPCSSPRAFLKELTSMRRQIIDSSREELISGSHQNCD